MKKKSGEQAKASRISLKERASRVLDVPADVFPKTVSTYMRGSCCAEILGSGLIICYTDKEIRLDTPEGELCIKGERLFCSSYRRGAVTVQGKINSIGFEED